MKIFGRVFDQDSGDPVVNANIFEAVSGVGTTTDSFGQFVLKNIFNYPVTIEISHIGYSKVVRLLNKQSDLEVKIILNRNFINMDQLVVTATRTEKKYNELAFSVEVISKDQIENSGSRNVADFLSLRAGVSMQSSYGGENTLNLLGLSSKHVLILIDSQPIIGKFNNSVSLDQISTGQVKKIEILKGPGSSLYGSEAMGGVINIITIDNKLTQKIEASARYNNSQSNIKNNGLGQGSNIVNLNITQPIRDMKFELNLNADNTKVDKSLNLLEIDNVDKLFVSSSLSFDLFKIRNLNLSFSVYDQSDNGSSKLMNTNTDIYRENFLLTHKISNISQTLSGANYLRRYTQKRPWGDLVRDDETTESFLKYDVRDNKVMGFEGLSSGLEFYKASYGSDRLKFGKQEVINSSLFGQYDFIFSKNISSVIGARWDRFSEYGSVFSPRIGAMYSFKNNWKFRFAVGQGFRAPSFIERFIDWNHAQFNYTVIGKSDLQPEMSTGGTLGIEYVEPKKYQASLVFYHTRFDNLIEDFVLGPGLLSYRNIRKANYNGLEFKSQLQLQNKWTTKLGANWIDNRDSNNNIIANTIPFSLNGSINYKPLNHFFKGSINVKWVASYWPKIYDPDKRIFIYADKKIKAYSIATVRGSFKISNSYQVSIGINNAGNYVDDIFGPFIGRTAYLEISTKLNNGRFKQ